MRGRLAVLLVLSAGVGCGDDDGRNKGVPDAPPPAIDAAIPDSLAIDGPPACKPTVLLVGGTDVTKQGWAVIQQAPATLTNGADFVQLDTSTPVTKPPAASGGQLLLTLKNATAFTPPFKLAIEMKILSIAPHNHDSLDAAVAFMLSLTGSVGTQPERSQMISIESQSISFADDTQTTPETLVDGAFHTYVLAIDANNTLTVTIDNQATPALTRDKITLNGTIAIGDQTNDATVDASTQIRSVSLLCL